MIDIVVMAFEICIANRYKFNKKYRKLLEKASSNPDDIVLQNSLKQAMVSPDFSKKQYLYNLIQSRIFINYIYLFYII